MTVVLILWMSLGLMLLSSMPAQGQANLDAVPPTRPEPEEPKFPKEPEQPPLRRPELPPVPPLSPKEQPRLPLRQFQLRQVRIVGNTVFAEETLRTVAEPYLNRDVTSEDLEALRRDLTRLYINAGYINSGAVLPDQKITNGTVTYRIIEGALTDVTFSGKRWFRDGYLRRRLTLGIAPPLNVNVLQTRLYRLQQDDRIEQLNAELRPGIRPGESELHVQVRERPPYFMALEFNNYQSVTIGAERGLLTLAHRNLTGHGDVLNFTYGRSAGLDLQVDTSYILPLTARDTTISLRYQRNNSSVISGLFDALDIQSRSETWNVNLRHPFYRDLRREFALTLGGKRAHSKSFLRDIPFSFSAGTENGESIVTALSLTAEWSDRTPRSVLALQSRFSVGIDALDATTHSDRAIPDSRFFAWLGQVQWARRLTQRDLQLRFRLTLQLSDDSLLPTEQIAVGGRFSVRGYRENQLIRDNALIVSMETLIPLVQHHRWADFVHVIPFIDFGRGWNRQVETPDPTNLASIGLGVRWAATARLVIPIRAQLDVWW
ncbi:MAG: ShlB/FhaC/HecB family hemolysin secretion/activation protein, partial [Candidatus Tectomicrobia bacterium]|nr:ShlB/FhaC/HecB family hemolysin secretion/activation protein [Candidatus Tectomicrobia bacterium]